MLRRFQNNYNYEVTWIPILDKRFGRVGISRCPGKVSPDKGSNECLISDLKNLRLLNISSIVTLLPDLEIRDLGISQFNENVKNLCFKHYIEPIEDYSIPNPDRLLHIKALCGKIMSDVSDDKSILIHCNAGKGRSGTLAALLIKLYRDCQDPVSYLRKYLPGAIETVDQEKFVARFR